VPAHQLPGALYGIADVEESLPISVLIRPSVHRWSPANPVRQRSLLQFGSQPGPLTRAQPLQRHRAPGQALGPQRLGTVLPGLVSPPYRPFGNP
jgi:hypothetical protein